jgi:hypothetical protein
MIIMKKPHITAAALAVLLALGLGVWAMLNRNDTVTRTPTPTTQAPEEHQDDTSEEPVVPSEDAANPEETEEPEPAKPSSDISVTITRTSTSGTVAAIVGGATSGTCKTLYTQGASTVTGSGKIVFNPTGYYSCTVHHEHTDFPAHGTWKLKLTATTPNGSASTTQNVTIDN